MLAVLDSIAGHVSIVDAATNSVLYMNNQLKKDFGGNREGEVCWKVFRGSLFPCVHCPIPRLLNGGGDDYAEVIEREGFNPLTNRWHINFDQIILWTDNRPAKLRIAFDITRFKEREAERLNQETLLQQSKKQEALRRMAGAIAHHFNNQLAVVIGRLELVLTDTSISFICRKQLFNAMRAARKSVEITNLLLQYLGLNTGVQSPLDLVEACRRSLPNLEKLLPSIITLNTDLTVRGLTVKADADLLDQILVRLATNAVEAIGERSGKVRLAVKAMAVTDIKGASLEPKDWRLTGATACCLEVNDTGGGIAAEHMDKIFDPFFTTKFTGRGLGLAVVLGIVKAWGGAIQVESTGEGSTFRILLPPTDAGREHGHNQHGDF